VSGTGYLPSLAMLGNGEGTMVIDLSDSEDDDDGGENGAGGSSSRDEGGRSGARSGEGFEAPHTGGGGSKAPSPAPPVVDAAEVERKRRLEEKEHEIERMMARIAEMERKKQALRDKKGAGGRQVQLGTPEVEAAAAAAAAAVVEPGEGIAQSEEEQVVEAEGEDVARDDEARESAQEDEPPLRVEAGQAGAQDASVEVRLLLLFLPVELELNRPAQDRPTPPPTSVNPPVQPASLRQAPQLARH